MLFFPVTVPVISLTFSGLEMCCQVAIIFCRSISEGYCKHRKLSCHLKFLLYSWVKGSKSSELSCSYACKCNIGKAELQTSNVSNSGNSNAVQITSPYSSFEAFVWTDDTLLDEQRPLLSKQLQCPYRPSLVKCQIPV